MTYTEKRGLGRLIEPDMLIALSAIVVSFCALGVSIVQVQLMRQEQRANAWPRVEAYVNTGTSFLMKLTNKGFGPAMIRGIVVTVDSIPVTDWDETMNKLMPDHDSIEYVQSKVTDVVLSPQTDFQIFRLADGQPSLEISDQAMRLGIQICYCSIYDDCWWLIRHSFGGGTRWQHEEVDECILEDSRRFKM